MIEVYIDGASAGNPGPSGVGIFIKGNGTVLEYSIPLGVMTNHEAEFTAIVQALQICVEKNILSASFRTDSQLVHDAMAKKYVKSQNFAPYLEEALSFIEHFHLFFIKWIPNSQNKIADKLAKAAIRKNN